MSVCFQRDRAPCPAPRRSLPSTHPPAPSGSSALRMPAYWPRTGRRSGGLSLRWRNWNSERAMDVTEWLQSLGLGRYAPDFAEHKVNRDVLPKLTVADLREIGVTAVGDRRRLLEAIGNLPTNEIATGAVSGEAERRQLTVMFCDLVNSMALATHLDPEDLREVIAAYHRTVTETVVKFDGFVARYMGDGVLVYFGYPRAHEDDPERAVRAGLRLVEAVGRLDFSLVKLQVRVGIATGLVVVGDLLGEGSAREQSVVGETPNLAARLQALAGPNDVVIAAGTRQLTG